MNTTDHVAPQKFAERGGIGNLILAGVGKAGTTSLFSYLAQHPDVAPSSSKETRFFLGASETDPAASRSLPPLQEYARYWSNASGERYRMEATPHYFHGGAKLASVLLDTCPDARIILTLRDPVDRLWSIYRFAKSMLQLPTELSISEFVATAYQLYRDDGLQTVENRPYWTSIAGSMYSRFTRPWIELVPRDRLRVVFFEDIAASPQRLVRDLCAWLGIDTHVESYSYDIQNRSVAYRNKHLHQVALFVNGERLLRNHRIIKKPLRSLYYRLNGCAPDAEMGEELRLELRRLFSDSNAQLATLLLDAGYQELPSWLTLDRGAA